MAKKYAYALPKHHVEHGVSIPVDELRIDDKAQRTLNEPRARSMAANLVAEALGTIVVSQRSDGHRYIVDGMHRWHASKLTGITELVAEVHHGLDQQEEAVLFLIKNRESSKPTPLDEYKIGLTAGLPLFVDTESALRRRNLTMGSTGTNTVGAVAGVLRITDLYGPETLERTLRVAEDAWGRTKETWDGMLLGGVGMFLGRHGGEVEDGPLAAKIGKKDPAFRWRANITALASAGGTRHSGTGSRISTCYTLIVTEWNKGKRAENRIDV
ncbi:DUF6551 family protein [Streptomyces sp. NPDC052071]|uniref:DUF6551 family protein n=1 Tax=Streptomyces TaxID=1883 RepID=UPI0004C9BC90|nr:MULTISPECIES: DUF6551 family protein [Streptomyces]MDX3182518.1 ParB N-terminal domain-containing protein [Streptomyces sp. ME02-7008A-1]MDX3302971.1 ParB N-terminal domain-containing protein [Streptomyces sp. ME02-7008A]MYT55793.1 ParB N-terminal domain-containing protein [Streptomyces sp. SID7834]WSK30192.1 ParB N-terminal domain-containing protein [[Kitasatospora] papulosa]WSZ48180.1 ParB N-terminal domain-containing protein [[Kitasatospora] papulosa]